MAERMEDLAADEKGSKLTTARLTDWMAFCSSLILLPSCVLLVANGTCSKPHRLTADLPVYVGGQLSIQAWLAILGLEFSILCTITLPKILSISISKRLTAKSIAGGVELQKLLNSQSTAPVLTQYRYGWKIIFFLRLLVALLVVAVTTAYKFSFVQVNRSDTIPVSADWTEIGASPQEPNQPCADITGWEGDGSFFDTNLRDIVSGTSNSILYTGSSWAANATSGPATLFVGPGINVTSVPQLLRGTVNRCVPAVYTKYTISTGTVPDSIPFVDPPFANGVRVQGYDNFTYLNAAGAADGSLNIIPVDGLTRVDQPGDPIQWGVNFTNMVTVVIEDCWGNFSWSNDAGYQVFNMQEPTDTSCTKRDMSDFTRLWNTTSSFFYANAIVTAYFARRGFMGDEKDWDAKKAIELMLLAILLENPPPQPLPGSINFSNPNFKALCDAHATQEGYNPAPCHFSPSKIALISGVMRNHGTGMTVLGMVLQGLIFVSAMAMLHILLSPGLPILTEWPAQWIGLTAALPREVISETVAGTSAGQNLVRGSVTTFLSSVHEGGSQRRPYLRLRSASGQVVMGVEHL